MGDGVVSRQDLNVTADGERQRGGLGVFAVIIGAKALEGVTK